MKYSINKEQKKIIALTAKGLTSKAIAVEMCISVNTVKYHKKIIFKKLQVSSITEALSVAYENKII